MPTPDAVPGEDDAMHLDLTDEETRALLNLLIEIIEADRYPMPRSGNAAKRRLETGSPPSKRRPQQSLSAPTQGAGLNDEAAAQPMKQRPPFADAGVVELGPCIYVFGLGLL
jgi:hypothetical protein